MRRLDGAEWWGVLVWRRVGGVGLLCERRVGSVGGGNIGMRGLEG